MTELLALFDALTSFAASLPFPAMLLASTVLLLLGTPVLLLLAGLSAIHGPAGLIAAAVALYSAAALLHLFVRLARTPARTGVIFPWLLIGAALVPFWPYVVLTTLRGAPLRRIAGAIAVVSTPNFILFGVAAAMGRSLAIHPLIPSIAAATIAVLIGLLLRRLLKGRHDDFPAASGIQRS